MLELLQLHSSFVGSQAPDLPRMPVPAAVQRAFAEQRRTPVPAAVQKAFEVQKPWVKGKSKGWGKGKGKDWSKDSALTRVIFTDFYHFFRTFLGDFNPQKLPSRRLQTLWEWKNRVLLEEFYTIDEVIPPEDDF